MQPDYPKIIISLVALVVGSWSIFGVIVNRWIRRTDEDIRELYRCKDEQGNRITAVETICKERHK